MLVNLLKKIDYNDKITEIGSKIPSISGLATSFPWTAVENKIINISNLVKKTIKSKYITTDDYNKFSKDIVTSKVKSEGLINKSDIAGFINNADLDKKKSSNISIQNWIKRKTRKNNKITSF